MLRLFFILLLAFSTSAHAIVIRHDVDDSKYRVPGSKFTALVDLPHEGHGVLIAPQWVVTAAHATQLMWHPITEVMIDGKCRKVERLIVHPGYKEIPKELSAGDSEPAMQFQTSRDDIALIKLAEPLSDVAPVKIYRANDESGKTVALIGKGATGNGTDGLNINSQHRTLLRRAYNVISEANDRWLGYVFDSGASAHPLEGTSGSGDSGGPVMIQAEGSWRLAGLMAWTYAVGDISAFRAGVYGLTNYAVRISKYAAWMDEVMAADEATKPELKHGQWQEGVPSHCDDRVGGSRK